MTSSGEEPALSDILARLKEAGDSDQVSFGDVLDAFGQRVYGPMLMVPAFLAVAPTGAIPGMSILTGAVILLVAVQLLAMRGRPWLPDRLEDASIPADKLASTIVRTAPYADKLDRFVRPRLIWLTAPPFQQGLSVVSILMAASMFPLALLPFAVAVPGTAVLLIGIGLTTRDGYFALAGAALALLVLIVPPLWAAQAWTNWSIISRHEIIPSAREQAAMAPKGTTGPIGAIAPMQAPAAAWQQGAPRVWSLADYWFAAPVHNLGPGVACHPCRIPQPNNKKWLA